MKILPLPPSPLKGVKQDFKLDISAIIFSKYICVISVGKKAEAEAEAKERVANVVELLKRRFPLIKCGNVPARKVV